MAANETITQTMKSQNINGVTSADFSTKMEEVQRNAVNYFIEEGFKLAKAEFQKLLDEKDNRIAQLEKELEKQKENKAKNPILDAPPRYLYKYDCVLFPQENGDVIIDCLIELTRSTRVNGKYLLTSKTDWFIVQKTLHYFKIYIGDEDDFLSNILPNVLGHMDDTERREKLSATKDNFKSIKSSNPMRAFSVDKWGIEARKEKERMVAEKQDNQRKSNAITTLIRCVNIKRELYDILIHHDVQVMNR